ncbi:MAG TPA: RimK family protein [Chitinispirillaceae bacterium]|nr:RimK family protein [Chitinispirillaceae bacterium]
MKKFIVITKEEDFTLSLPEVEIVTAKEYLTDERFTDIKNARVYNLCRQYRYQAAGYYVSLLAEARGHRPVPSVTTMRDAVSQTITKSLSDDIDHLIQQSLHRITSKEFTISIYFGKNLSKQYDALCRALYTLFESPLLRAFFVFKERWQLQRVSTISLKDIPVHHMQYVGQFAREYFTGRKIYTAHLSRKLHSVAILVDPKEKAPPSDEKALKKFVNAAEKSGLETKFIERDDLSDIAAHDGLFIRATTAVNNFTYQFARKASAEGLVVVDDPLSILRCTNKVYLSELLGRLKIPTPKTLILNKDNIQQAIPTLGLPLVLKLPDSSFSQGVIKVSSESELNEKLKDFFEHSDFIVAQEFIPTDFDWRIGILGGRPLFACKYFMARNHWQIYNWSAASGDQSGKWETIPVELAPPDAVKYALRATAPIGNGFYGVDIKDYNGRMVVIEVNDNPSVESGVEDLVLKDQLYESVAGYFLRCIEQQQKVFLI